MSCCKRCNSGRVLDASAKTSDGFGMWIAGNEYTGYVPRDIGIGGGDYVKISYCLDCGQIQGNFPLEKLEIEEEKVDEDEEEDGN